VFKDVLVAVVDGHVVLMVVGDHVVAVGRVINAVALETVSLILLLYGSLRSQKGAFQRVLMEILGIFLEGFLILLFA
tara:strand:+ start:14243 stop:14473 length:231 start_codon:yes stop_codon:yes gene_type:complete